MSDIWMSVAAALVLICVGPGALGQKRNTPEVGLSPETVVCGSQCANPVYRRGDTVCTDEQRNQCLVEEAAGTLRRVLKSGVSAETACTGGGGEVYRFVAFASVYPEASCRVDARRIATLIAAEPDPYSDAELARRRLLREEQEKNEAAAAVAAHQADLRSGKRAPVSLGEYLLKRGDGHSLPALLGARSAPDGRTYALSGVIESLEGQSAFVARASNGLAVEAQRAFRGQNDPDPTYFRVRVPKAAMGAYAQVGRTGLGVFVVAKYVGNANYRTISGQARTMPVLELIEVSPW